MAPRKITGIVPAALTRSKDRPFSYAMTYQRRTEHINISPHIRTIDISSKREARILGDKLDNIGIGTVNIVVFL